ncbi:MAG: M28 family peptidase [Phycisphaerae bacterium]
MARRKTLTEAEEQVREGLHRHLTMLSDVIGIRNTDRPGGLEAAARYIEDTLRRCGYTPRPLPYHAGRHEVRNIEVVIEGTRRPEQIFILGAHYDSVDCPAANDNGSGVAGVLEVARLLAGKRFRRTVRLVFFVNEEPPYYKGPDMGSLVYARKCRERNDDIRGMINLETIACYSDAPGSQRYPVPFNSRWFWFLPKRGNFITFVGDLASWRLTWQVRRVFKRAAKFPSLWFPSPAHIEGPGMSDHWSFWQQGYRGVMVTDTAPFRYDHYHKPSDTIDKLDLPRTARVVAGMAAVMERLAGKA